tara:strand:+ start:369 stop:479 length:111 start_codon:yes stop_codon:yes gene_type:complete
MLFLVAFDALLLAWALRRLLGEVAQPDEAALEKKHQ